MSIQKLSNRLQAAADFVTYGSRTADVGTDHAFLPIYLVQSGKCQKVIAMDIRKGPLERAEEHIAAAKLQACIQTRLSDGLKELSGDEADCIVIAGMGGLTMIRILEDGMSVLAHVKELVLGPQSDTAKVRKFLREHGMYIDQEDLVCEEGKYYPILHAVKTVPKQDGDRERLQRLLLKELGDEARVSQITDQYGACIICARHPVLFRLLEREEKREAGILQALEKHAVGTKGIRRDEARRTEVKRKLQEIHILQKIIERQDAI